MSEFQKEVREAISSLDLHSIVEDVIRKELRDFDIAAIVRDILSIRNPYISKIVLDFVKSQEYAEILREPINRYLMENLPRLTEKVIREEIEETDLESDVIENVLDIKG